MFEKTWKAKKKFQYNRGQKQQINLIELKVGSYKVYTCA